MHLLICLLVCLCISAVRHAEEDGVHKDSANRLVAGLVNIRAIVNHFTPKIDSWSASHQVASLTPDQVSDCFIRMKCILTSGVTQPFTFYVHRLAGHLTHIQIGFRTEV